MKINSNVQGVECTIIGTVAEATYEYFPGNNRRKVKSMKRKGKELGVYGQN